MATRPTKDEYFMRMAQLVATRGTCLRRQVGCVLVNARGHVIATGYNGPPAGRAHCIAENPCRAAHARSGERLDECFAIHAEQNALLQCHDVHSIETAYITVAPCATCLKLFLNTSCRRLVVGGWYAPEHQAALDRWWRGPDGVKYAVSQVELL